MRSVGAPVETVGVKRGEYHRPTVWVVQENIYEDRDIQGIYATLELAMQANPGHYTRHEDGSYSNDRDFSQYRFIRELGVKGT